MYCAVIVTSAFTFNLSSLFHALNLYPAFALTLGANPSKSISVFFFTKNVSVPISAAPCSPLSKVTFAYPAGVGVLGSVTSIISGLYTKEQIDIIFEVVH